MMHSDITSRPTYRALEPDLAGSKHLLVIEGETLLTGRLEALTDTFAPVNDKLHTWLVGAPTASSGAPIPKAMKNSARPPCSASPLCPI